MMQFKKLEINNYDDLVKNNSNLWLWMYNAMSKLEIRDKILWFADDDWAEYETKDILLRVIKERCYKKLIQDKEV